MVVNVRPLKTGSHDAVREVAFNSVKRFGRYHQYCNARTPTVAELDSGEIVLAYQKDQSSQVSKLIQLRMRKVGFPPKGHLVVREAGELICWEGDAP